ncbi:hypothetical protein [Methylicorpusculum sp.]|uniref:hypothetical protein n=1 Tax=Methylicorpusculum sp. TaxID=2713644 RepID=UPI002731A603|nr:hypothetical protein [Methylicorpusculum sp.]MDP2178047.1 hypothetical protein [Methylicorpusculum sp.]MDP3528947.1 hypothetical protein [Methylicorpusculum sp.]MDZ4153060.1 hypothetical protein [Methylicorpusculum sp.]
MTTFNWTKQGETLSHKNASKEFGLTEQEIFEGIKQGKLQYQISYAHGNPYYRLLRMEVLAFVEDMHGSQYLEEQKISHQLKTITREINSLKIKLATLEKQRIELINRQKNKVDPKVNT